jgi:hypothetical protein
LWPPKWEAAKLLGIGERTLDRQISRSAFPEVRMRVRSNGRKPEPVVNPEDLKTMLAKRNRAVVMPADKSDAAAPAAWAALAMREAGINPEQVVQQAGMARVLNALGFPHTASSVFPVRQEPRLWLGLKAAADYSGLSMALLQRLCAAGCILAVKDNGWKIQRAALDEMGENLAGFLDAERGAEDGHYGVAE